jgi:hypothetical protein
MATLFRHQALHQRTSTLQAALVTSENAQQPRNSTFTDTEVRRIYVDKQTVFMSVKL